MSDGGDGPSVATCLWFDRDGEAAARLTQMVKLDAAAIERAAAAPPA